MAGWSDWDGGAYWSDPASSATRWLEEATGPWREGTEKATTDQLIAAAQVAATLAVAERFQAVIRLNDDEDVLGA